MSIRRTRQLHAAIAPFVVLMVGVGSARSVETQEAPFHIQAHRGAGIGAPENTIEAFTLSWNMGVTPEADLRTTADGVIVCFHDADFRRVVGNVGESRRGQGIEDLPISEVEQLEVGKFRGEQFTGQRVPALASLLAALKIHPERLVYLDIKSENVNLDQLAKQILDSGTQSQVIFTTKHHDLIRDWKRRVPDSLTLIWNGGTEAELKKKLAALRDADFEGITHLQIHVKAIDRLDAAEPFQPSIAFLEQVRDELKQHGIVFQVLPWECSDRAVFVKLLELGAESFATDYPQITLDAVREYREGKPAQ